MYSSRRSSPRCSASRSCLPYGGVIPGCPPGARGRAGRRRRLPGGAGAPPLQCERGIPRPQHDGSHGHRGDTPGGEGWGVGFRLEIDPRQHARAETEGLRFSIRDLMLFIAAAALLTAHDEGSARITIRDFPTHRRLGDVLHRRGAGLALGGAWGRPPSPAGHGCIGPLAGPGRSLFALAVHASPSGFVYIVLTMLLYSALLLGSLLVVRSCGYRFVRRAASLSGPTVDGAGVRPSPQVPHD